MTLLEKNGKQRKIADCLVIYLKLSMYFVETLDTIHQIQKPYIRYMCDARCTLVISTFVTSSDCNEGNPRTY